MSNFKVQRGRATEERAAPVCRVAQGEETHAALRLILGSGGKLASEGQVVDFLRFALHRGIDQSAMWVAESGGQLQWAILPVQSPGHTMLLFAPTFISSPRQHLAAEMLTEELVGGYRQRGVQLAQVLLEPMDGAVMDFYRSASFEVMAELIYLQAMPRRLASVPWLPEGYRWVGYSLGTHERFAATIAATYRGSLDCPALNGLRGMDDVIAGHKAAGQFEPRMWFLLCKGDIPHGVLLLTRTPQSDALELVYLGLAPEARGQDLGELLIRQALAVAAHERCARLTLAVDSQNAPALKLYFRHGFKRLTAKMALMRDLRKNAVAVVR
jgi:mycothiol synthase